MKKNTSIAKEPTPTHPIFNNHPFDTNPDDVDKMGQDQAPISDDSTPALLAAELAAIEKRYQVALQQRQEWMEWWRECYQYALPQYDKADGFAKQPSVIYDSTAVLAVEQLASNLVHDLLPNSKGGKTSWFDMSAVDGAQHINELLAAVSNDISQQLQQGDFYLEVHQAMLDLVVAGTGVLAVEKNNAGGINFRALPLTSIVLEEKADNHHGGAVFKQSRLPWDKIENLLLANNDGDATITTQQLKKLQVDDEGMVAVVEALLPNGNPSSPEENGAVDYMLFAPGSDDDAVSPNAASGQLASQGESAGSHGPLLISQGRFRQMPLLVFRFTKAPGENYGRSPVMRALPDIITANQVVELILKNASLNVSGIWLVDDDGVINVNNLKLEPGAIIQKAVGSPGLTPLRTAGLDLSQVVLAELRQNIKRALLSDTILNNNVIGTGLASKTATEVRQINESQTRAMAASFRRLEHELLQPLVQRLLGLMVDEGRAPRWVLDKKIVRLQMSSPIARRQEMQEAENMLSLLQTAAAVGLDLTQYVDRGELVKKLFHYFQLPLSVAPSMSVDHLQNVAAVDAALTPQPTVNTNPTKKA